MLKIDRCLTFDIGLGCGKFQVMVAVIIAEAGKHLHNIRDNCFGISNIIPLADNILIDSQHVRLSFESKLRIMKDHQRP